MTLYKDNEIMEVNDEKIVASNVKSLEDAEQGYDRAIVEKMIVQLEADSRFDVIIVDYVKGNDVMGKLLESLGFEYGEFEEVNNEYVMKVKK